MKSDIMHSILRDLSAFGALPFYLFISLFLLILGEIKLFWVLFIGLLLSYFFAFSIRLFYFKNRPIKVKYHNILEKIDASSFPSLHSWRIALLWLVLCFYYSNLVFWVLFGVLALIVLFSRYYLKKHYFTDILFGAVFGLIEGIALIVFSKI
jgi:undecaprenyl-diphosphatase